MKMEQGHFQKYVIRVHSTSEVYVRQHKYKSVTFVSFKILSVSFQFFIIKRHDGSTFPLAPPAVVEVKSSAFSLFKCIIRQHVSVFCCCIKYLLCYRWYCVSNIPEGHNVTVTLVEESVGARFQAPVGGDCHRCS